MLIKVNGRELEMSENSNFYLGSPKKGQIFREKSDLNENTLKALANIQEKAEDLIIQAEQLLSE